MADRQTLTNDALTSARQPGTNFDDRYFTVAALASETSALTGSATQVPVWVADCNGRVVDFYIAIGSPPVSASGFVSGNVSANIRINSVQILSTTPQFPGVAGSAGNAGKQATNTTFTSTAAKPSPISAVINTASAAFSVGDMISIDWHAVSTGSAAAGTAGKGLTVVTKVRLAAR